MAVEIERKFLLLGIPEQLNNTQSKELRQGYLAIAPDGSEARIRCSGDVQTMTIKQGKGLSRQEDEIVISNDLFDALWPATDGRRIEKIRHVLLDGENVIEVDRYEGKLTGLVVAEVEFDSEAAAQAWRPPEWIGREITEEACYKNQQLALLGMPTKHSS